MTTDLGTPCILRVPDSVVMCVVYKQMNSLWKAGDFMNNRATVYTSNEFRRTVLALSDVLSLFEASPDTSVTHSSHPLTRLPQAALSIQQALRNSL